MGFAMSMLIVSQNIVTQIVNNYTVFLVLSNKLVEEPPSRTLPRAIL